jgi:hypothetical protein
MRIASGPRRTMKPLALRILKIFEEMKQERLDLHVLFEAAGNEPAERERVLDAVEELLNIGVLENRGGDFYSLTAKGKQAIVEV